MQMAMANLAATKCAGPLSRPAVRPAREDEDGAGALGPQKELQRSSGAAPTPPKRRVPDRRRNAVNSPSISVPRRPSDESHRLRRWTPRNPLTPDSFSTLSTGRPVAFFGRAASAISAGTALAPATPCGMAHTLAEVLDLPNRSDLSCSSYRLRSRRRRCGPPANRLQEEKKGTSMWAQPPLPAPVFTGLPPVAVNDDASGSTRKWVAALRELEVRLPAAARVIE